jgi:tetratricopeptide (TPR) repeat protein
MNLAVALEWQGNLSEAAAHLQEAREIDPYASEKESDYGIAFFNREQYLAALKESDCSGIVAFGEKILAVTIDDTDIDTAIAACALKQGGRPTQSAPSSQR